MIFWCIFVVWAVSFVLPAIDIYDWGKRVTALGIEAMVYSMVRGSLMFWVYHEDFSKFQKHPQDLLALWYGLLWTANLPMLASPLLLNRVLRFKGKIFALILVAAVMFPLRLYKRLGEVGILGVHLGLFVWIGALAAMALFFLWFAFVNRPSIFSEAPSAETPG